MNVAYFVQDEANNTNNPALVATADTLSDRLWIALRNCGFRHLHGAFVAHGINAWLNGRKPVDGIADRLNLMALTPSGRESKRELLAAVADIVA